ncbi:hypothetical protein [Ornithinicoccus hortensis]|uniref:Uncharacterized protein n=1 Tax=Ornithinicoccus hortensis TaxID=82346 RepID=A0A542YSD9_9MICO|nr:hypothetical protein [Ornithinicoccus hortensis]TQL51009.1 hypothetical protein FB467_2142 [Ornithinicoccus hortensis]
MRRILLVPALAAAVLTASCGAVEEPATDPSPTAEQSATEEEATTTSEEETATDEETAEEPEETSEEPEESTEEAAPPAQECSSSGYTAGELNAGDSPDPVVQLATTLLDAAVDCDPESLIAAAEADQPSLSFGEVPAEEALALPDVEGRYLALAVLLTATSPSQEVYEGDGAVTVWPAAYSAGATDADWQEIVDAGLYSADEVEQMRGAEGYSGWRVGIAEDGTWLFFVAGD